MVSLDLQQLHHQIRRFNQLILNDVKQKYRYQLVDFSPRIHEMLVYQLRQLLLFGHLGWWLGSWVECC
jgi:hypothetical protein